MSQFPKYKLEEVCDIQIGKTPRRDVDKYWGKGYTWVSISDMKSAEVTTTKEEITEVAVRECGCKLIPKGTILLSFKLSIGKIAFAGKDLFTNEAIVGLPIRRPDIIHSRYLYYVLRNIPLVGSNNAAMGSTLNKESLRVLNLPIPNIEDQLRIADILSKVESLISQRKESIRLLDELLKSTFLEMFGTITQPKYKTETLNNLCIKITDGTHQSPKFLDSGIPFILVSNIVNNEINYDTTKYISEADYDELIRRTPIEVGDILFTTVGSYGNAALVKSARKFCFQRHIGYIKPDRSKIDSVYLFGALKSPFVKNQVDKAVKGVAQLTLNLSELKNILVPLPPINLQKKFAYIVEKVDDLKSHYQTSLQELENLYGALSQRAFRQGA